MEGLTWTARQYLSNKLTQHVVQLQMFLGQCSLPEEEYDIIEGVFNGLEEMIKEIEDVSAPAPKKKSASPARNKRSRKAK